MLIFTPIFHHFNVNDNVIILISSVSMISAQMIRAFAKNKTVFFGSVGADFGSSMFMAPIRKVFIQKKKIWENLEYHAIFQ